MTPAADAALPVLPEPAAAADVFAERLDLARRYADLLVTSGVERGLLGPRERGRVWSRHLLNSAAAATLIRSSASVVDLGSGAGLPGIPLALARPDLQVTLLEPMQRRVEFLREVVEELALPVAVIRGRAETVDGRWDVAVARAVAPLVHLVPLARRLLRRPSSELLAFKGRAVSDEVEEARAVLARSGSVVTIHEVGVDDWRTTVAVVTRGAQTPPDGRRSASREEVRRRA